MEAVSGLKTTQGLIDALKVVPAWFFVGTCLVLLAIRFVPGFYDLVPEATKPWIPLAFFTSAVLALCQIASSIIPLVLVRRRESAERDRQRLIHLYRPIVALFLTRHVTMCSSAGAPRLRHRLENAASELGYYRRWRVGVRRALRALFDRQRSTSAEVEFGGDFPLDKIVELTRQKAEFADEALLNRVGRAHRSRYEEPRSDLLTDAELDLFEHIEREHERLSRRLG